MYLTKLGYDYTSKIWEPYRSSWGEIWVNVEPVSSLAVIGNYWKFACLAVQVLHTKPPIIA